MEIKKQSFLTLFLSLVITFIAGIIVGGRLGNPELSEISKVIKSSELSTESFLIEQEFLKGYGQSCDLAKIRLSSLSNELWQLGKLLEAPNAQKDLGEQDFSFLKRKYHLMQIRTYSLYYRLNSECGIEVPVVLFYYGKKDKSSEKQGMILDRLVEDQDIKVFAIEYNYSEELQFLQDYYGIKRTPALVVGYKTVREGITSYEEIKEELFYEQ